MKLPLGLFLLAPHPKLIHAASLEFSFPFSWEVLPNI